MRESATKRVLLAALLAALGCIQAGAAEGDQKALQATPAMPAFPWFHGAPNPQAFMPGPHPYMRWMYGAMAPAFMFANPSLYHQWAGMFTNPMVDAFTRHSTLDAMMRGFDPRAFGMVPRGDGSVPGTQIPGFPTQTPQKWRPNTVTEGVSTEAKRNFYQAMMMASPLSMRDMVGIMAKKMLVAEDVSFDDAVESMKLRANEVNFKLVGHNQVWLDVRAISGDENTPRVEIFQFCDAMIGRQILDYVPEFAVFLPCRIALLEDADRRIWVMTLDWDISWLDYAQNPNSVLDAGLRKEAARIKEAIVYIMEGAATGDF